MKSLRRVWKSTVPILVLPFAAIYWVMALIGIAIGFLTSPFIGGLTRGYMIFGEVLDRLIKWGKKP